MCGFVGALTRPAHQSEEALRAAGERMGGALRHRGPDDSGVWLDPASGVSLVHRRLSIIDLSPEGHQPMLSRDGRYVLAFNGEIYNYPAVREELDRARAGGPWRGHSDTEVMLAAFVHWGVRGALERLNGMFAFALWDREERVLYLARDRAGEKPLYFGWVGGAFLFGSELKALRQHPAWHGEIDRGALALFMRHNYVPGPHTIYQRVTKLAPGALLTMAWGDGAAGREARVERYWSARAVARAGVVDPFAGSEAEAAEQLEELLRDAVALRMHADVPLGAFLSGGVDSSLVVALMRAQSERAPRTFSIGFQDPRFDEAQHARAVAAHLGTDHTELYVSPEQALDVIPRLPHVYDEPFADSSQIPTMLVAELARRDVTVALSGDGGDELFGGYNRYFWSRRLWRRMAPVPVPLRRLASRGLLAVSPGTWDAIGRRMLRALPAAYHVARPGDNVHRLATVLPSRHPAELYRRLVSHWDPPARLVRLGAEPTYALSEQETLADVGDFTQQMMYLDLVTYLPDDILVKVDRATMAYSLEARVPLLDHRLIEFAWRLPSAWRVSGTGKRLLRQVLYRYVPRELIERPKMGFGVPLDAWLRGPLREWAAALLEPERLRREGFLDPAIVGQAWREHLAGTRNSAYLLWDVLMFQAWYEAQA